jgi:hypothetical protein
LFLLTLNIRANKYTKSITKSKLLTTFFVAKQALWWLWLQSVILAPQSHFLLFHIACLPPKVTSTIQIKVREECDVFMSLFQILRCAAQDDFRLGLCRCLSVKRSYAVLNAMSLMHTYFNNEAEYHLGISKEYNGGHDFLFGYLFLWTTPTNMTGLFLEAMQHSKLSYFSSSHLGLKVR